MPRIGSKLNPFVIAFVFGLFVAVLSGFIEKSSEGVILGAKSFGYPWAWRYSIVQSASESIFRFDNLAADITFWAIALFFVLALIGRHKFKSFDNLVTDKRLVFSAILLVPMGLLMSLFHELGHLLVGTALGGTLSYFQVGFFELYPKLSLVYDFRLGSVIVNGLYSSTQQGLFLLAGSSTAIIAALVIGILLNATKIDNLARLSLKILGVIGLLDMPFYVFFSSLGLRHWLLLGENRPEPLIGARLIGIPEPVFFLVVAVITFVLSILYSSWVRISIVKVAEELRRTILRKNGGALKPKL